MCSKLLGMENIKIIQSKNMSKKCLKTQKIKILNVAERLKFACILFFIATLLRIWLAVTVERVETATFNPRVENRSFNPLYRYRKSDFQRRRYEKQFLPWFYKSIYQKMNFSYYISCKFKIHLLKSILCKFESVKFHWWNS